jgi:hypothetical protein
MLIDLIFVHLLIGAFLGLWAMWDLGNSNGDYADPVLQICAVVAIFLLTAALWPTFIYLAIRREVRRWNGWAEPEVMFDDD